MFKSTVMTCVARVCGLKSIGRKKRGSAWWDEEITCCLWLSVGTTTTSSHPYRKCDEMNG